MERQGIIKYFEHCFETLNDWIEESLKSPEIAREKGKRQIMIEVIHGFEKAKPIFTNSFLFGYINPKERVGQYPISDAYDSCCIIVDDAFVNIWFHPEWEYKNTRYQNNYYWPEKRLYFVDGSNELVQDRYIDKFALEFPLGDSGDSFIPKGIPDLFIAQKSIFQIEMIIQEQS